MTNMYDSRIDEIVKKKPALEWLKTLAETGIVVLSPHTEEYINDPNQLYLKRPSENVHISRQFIIDILSHDDSFEKIKVLFEKSTTFIITLFINKEGDIKNNLNLTKRDIIILLKQINIEEFPFIKKRYYHLIEYASYNTLKNQTKNQIYTINIEGKEYNLPVSLFYEFLDLDSAAYNEVISSGKGFHDIQLEHFLYAIGKYFKDNRIPENYLLEEVLQKRLSDIYTSKEIDIQTINEYLDTNDSLLALIKVNEDLEKEVLKGLPQHFNSLEKSIYIYIKLCKILTYDDEYYAINQIGPLAKKHKTLSNIPNISPTNNKVVCYEFDAIYSYLLHQIDLNFKRFVNLIDINGNVRESIFDNYYDRYSDSHTFLKYRCGKFLIKADSVTTILNGDIMQAKLNQPLAGLICENTNEKTQEEFSNAVAKVYNYIADQEDRISQNPPGITETFDMIATQFTQLTDKIQPVDIKEKTEILINKINSSKMIGIDAYSYLLQLRYILFTPEERQNNIQITIIRNSKTTSAEAIAIISITLTDISNQMITNNYIFRPGYELIPISKEQLQEKFNTGEMSYIEENSPEIPGIKK